MRRRSESFSQLHLLVRRESVVRVFASGRGTARGSGLRLRGGGWFRECSLRNAELFPYSVIFACWGAHVFFPLDRIFLLGGAMSPSTSPPHPWFPPLITHLSLDSRFRESKRERERERKGQRGEGGEEKRGLSLPRETLLPRQATSLPTSVAHPTPLCLTASLSLLPSPLLTPVQRALALLSGHQ